MSDLLGLQMKSLISAAIPAPPLLLLTSRQAAASLQISERTLWELTRRGEIKRLKINSSVRYDLKDLEAFIAKKKGGVL